MKSKTINVLGGTIRVVTSSREPTLCWGSEIDEINHALGFKFNIEDYEVANVTNDSLILKEHESMGFVVFKACKLSHDEVGEHHCSRLSVVGEWEEIQFFNEHGVVDMSYHNMVAVRHWSDIHFINKVSGDITKIKALNIFDEPIISFEDAYQQVMGRGRDWEPSTWKESALSRFVSEIMEEETDWDALDW